MQWKETPLATALSCAGTDISDDTFYSCADRMESDWSMERLPSGVLPGRSAPSIGDTQPLCLLQLPDDALHHIFSFLSTTEKLQSCQFVCKRMYHALYSSSRAWNSIDTHEMVPLPSSDAVFMGPPPMLSVHVERHRPHHVGRPQVHAAPLGTPRSMRGRQQGMLQWLQRVGHATETFKGAFGLGDASDTPSENSNESMEVDNEEPPLHPPPMHVNIHAVAGTSTMSTMQLQNPAMSPSHHAWSSLQQRMALQHLAASCHNAAAAAKGWLLSRSPAHVATTHASLVPLMPMVADVFGCLRRLRRLELDYVNAEHAMHLTHLTALTSLSLGQVSDCAKVLAKHCTFPELQELRLVNVRDMDDHHGVSKGCHVFRYPQLRKLELFDSVTDMTSCVSALTALTELRVANLLAHSRLTVAPEIGTLTNLQVLYMHAEYGCQIPQALCRLTQLRRLGLAGNCDMSQLDGSIKHLRQLQTLYLANMAYVAWNELIGQFQALPLLDTLSFEGCRLEALPPCIILSTNLRALNLHNNLLEDLPHGPYLHRLEYLDLSHNYITKVPQALASAPALCHVDLSYNSNNAKQACLSLDAEGLAVFGAMPALRFCALVRYDESDMEEKLAEEYYRPMTNHEIAALLKLSTALAAKGGIVEVYKRTSTHTCGCMVCAGGGAPCGRASEAPVWF